MFERRKATIAIAVAPLLLLSAGCGGQSADQQLHNSQIEVAAAGVALNCGDTAILTGQVNLTETQQAVDDLIALTRNDPDYKFTPAGSETEVTLRQFLGDQATEVAKCSPELAAKIDRALDTL